MTSTFQGKIILQRTHSLRLVRDDRSGYQGAFKCINPENP
jgi:hypothetical protein